MKADSGPDAGPLASLTRREAQVVLAIGQALSVREIARELEISTRTVESHLWQACRKLGVHNRVELVRLLLRYDAITLDS